MPGVGGKKEIRSRLKSPRPRLALKLDFGTPLQHDQPFVFVLVVPETIRRAMPSRNDSLDPQSAGFVERREQLLGQARGNARIYIPWCHGLFSLDRNHLRRLRILDKPDYRVLALGYGNEQRAGKVVGVIAISRASGCRPTIKNTGKSRSSPPAIGLRTTWAVTSLMSTNPARCKRSTSVRRWNP